MRVPRFFAPHLSSDTQVELTGAEYHHAVDVLRLKVGSALELFDEEGRTAPASVVNIDSRGMRVLITGPVCGAHLVRRRLHMVVAAPKQKRVDWMVEKCAELGVSSLQFIETERSVVKLRDSRIDRLQQKATEAAKQSGALPVMMVYPSKDLKTIVTEFDSKGIFFFGSTEEEAKDILSVLRERPGTGSSENLHAFIGPEGGWTLDEITLLQSMGAHPVRLNANVLRVETAAIALAAICRAHFDRP